MCLIQGRSNFFNDIVIQASSVRTGISILGVATGRQSKISKELFLNIEIQGLSVSSFHHCDVRGVTRAPCILIRNIKEAGSARSEISGKVINNLGVVVRVGERCAVGFKGPTRDDTGIEYVREIYTYPSPSQIQEKFRVPCVFRSSDWGV